MTHNVQKKRRQSARHEKSDETRKNDSAGQNVEQRIRLGGLRREDVERMVEDIFVKRKLTRDRKDNDRQKGC